MRNHTFEIGEYYHIYNRGNNKRDIILNKEDLSRFVQSIVELNIPEPIGSLFELSFRKKNLPELGSSTTKLVSIVAYCVNPNHFHLLLTPLVENGIEKFMQKLGGYTRYFNEKNKNSGSLFQGRFKSKHIKNDRYLNHVSAYINMNNRNLLGSSTTKLSRSSLEEYIGDTVDLNRICDTDIVLGQFQSKKAYAKFALESWQDTQKRKRELKMTDLDFLLE